MRRQSLHLYLSFPCAQMPLPPHSLHWGFCLPCGQMPLPPHSLHVCFSLPCSHFARFRPLSPPVAGAPRFCDAAPPTVPSASSGNVRSSVCGSKPIGPVRIAGSHASSDGSGLIGFAAAEEGARPHDSYATTRHSSSIAEATLPRWQPTNVSIPDLEAVWNHCWESHLKSMRSWPNKNGKRPWPGVCLRRCPQRTLPRQRQWPIGGDGHARRPLPATREPAKVRKLGWRCTFQTASSLPRLGSPPSRPRLGSPSSHRILASLLSACVGVALGEAAETPVGFSSSTSTETCAAPRPDSAAGRSSAQLRPPVAPTRLRLDQPLAMRPNRWLVRDVFLPEFQAISRTRAARASAVRAPASRERLFARYRSNAWLTSPGLVSQ